MNRRKALDVLDSSADYIRHERERAAYYLPRITETTHRGEREWDIYSRLLKDRIVFVGTEIDLVGQWQLNKFTTLEAAYCHFFRGSYIEDSLAKSGSQDADYVYVQLQVQF